MKKNIIILFITLVFSLLYGEVWITCDKIGMQGEGGNSDYSVMHGETITITVEYTTHADDDDVFNATKGPYSLGNQDKVTVLWYTGYSGGSLTGHLGNNSYDCTWISQGSAGTHTKVFDFDLPGTLPYSSATYMQLSFGIYGDFYDASNGYALTDYFPTIANQYISHQSWDILTSVSTTDPPAGYRDYLDVLDGTIIKFRFGAETESILIPISIDWENIILTYDKTDVKIYVDNVLIDTKTIGDVSSNYSTRGLFVGGMNWGSFGNGFIGSEDEVAIFKKVLTAEDRAIIIGGGTMKTVGDCRTISECKAYWRFEEPAGTTVTDWAK